jgi:hypothetical protein
MAEPLRIDYEGPARVIFEEGAYPDIEIGTPEQMMRWWSAESLSERLFDAAGGKRDEGGCPVANIENVYGHSWSRVRISIEVLDASPVTKPVDPLEVSEGPQLPWPADPPDEPLR